jgi:hypothetical protein
MIVSADSPCRTAFLSDPSFAIFRGRTGFFWSALRELASICRNEVMGWWVDRSDEAKFSKSLSGDSGIVTFRSARPEHRLWFGPRQMAPIEGRQGRARPSSVFINQPTTRGKRDQRLRLTSSKAARTHKQFPAVDGRSPASAPCVDQVTVGTRPAIENFISNRPNYAPNVPNERRCQGRRLRPGAIGRRGRFGNVHSSSFFASQIVR